MLSSEYFQIICHCLSNDHDFTLIPQKKYTLIRIYGMADMIVDIADINRRYGIAVFRSRVSN